MSGMSLFNAGKNLLPKKPLLLSDHMDLMKIATSFSKLITKISATAVLRDDASKGTCLIVENCRQLYSLLSMLLITEFHLLPSHRTLRSSEAVPFTKTVILNTFFR